MEQKINGFKNLTAEDYLPIRKTVEAQADFLIANGYEEISPTLFSTLRDYLLSGENDQKVMKCIDRDGGMLVLKNDYHNAVEEMLAGITVGKLSRYFYHTKAYHLQGNREGEREETVLSSELIGCGQTEGEAEMIALAIDSARLHGAKNPIIRMNHTGIFEGILTASQSRPVTLFEILSMLDGTPLVGIPDIAQQRIRETAKLRGDISVVETASGIVNNRMSVDALLHLVEIYQMLAECGYEKEIRFDLGLLPEKHYRKGCFFVLEEEGNIQMSGGRNRSFGVNATLSLDFHLSALCRLRAQRVKNAEDRRVLLGLHDSLTAIKKGYSVKKSLQESDLSVQILYRTTCDALAVYAADAGIENFIFVDESGELKN